MEGFFLVQNILIWAALFVWRFSLYPISLYAIFTVLTSPQALTSRRASQRTPRLEMFFGQKNAPEKPSIPWETRDPGDSETVSEKIAAARPRTLEPILCFSLCQFGPYFMNFLNVFYQSFKTIQAIVKIMVSTENWDQGRSFPPHVASLCGLDIKIFTINQVLF